MAETELISYGRRTTMLAAEHPEKTAIIFVADSGAETAVSWGQLERRSNQIARLLARHQIGPKSLLVIGLPNSLEHIYATLAGWKVGALVLPLRAALPGWERDRVLDVGKPNLIIADWERAAFPLIGRAELHETEALSDAPLPDCIPHPGRAIASGGSTGHPKIIVDPRPWATRPGENYFGYGAGYMPGQVQLLAGPLYHNSPHGWAFSGLFDDQTLVVMARFNEALVVDLIERHRVNFMFMSPTMMARIARLPEVSKRDFSSLEAIYHTSAVCPKWVKQFWIDLIGAENVYEGYGSTEGIGAARIRGDEWLLHPGSVGRPHNTLLKILGPDGESLPPGEIGEIYTKRPHGRPTYEYIGRSPLPVTPDGYASVGDLGWLDEDGYLYIADRRTDMIITGGANVYPAEVEAALSEHPEIADLVVIGLPNEAWGRSVHAVIQPRNPQQPPTVEELNQYCRERLSAYKVPKSYEFLAALPRNQMGKIRRSDMTRQREEHQDYAIIWLQQ